MNTPTVLATVCLLLAAEGDPAKPQPEERRAAEMAQAAAAAEKAEKWTEARKARQEVLAIWIKLHGEKHWQVTDARLAQAHTELLAKLSPEQRRQLGEVEKRTQAVEKLYQQSKYAAAVPDAKAALALCQKVLGDEHRQTADCRTNQALLLQGLAQYAEARKHLEQALAIRKKVLGPNHPDTAAGLNHLGSLLQDMGEYPAAQPLYEQALAVQRQTLGIEHAATAQTLNDLGTLLQTMGKLPDARPHLEQALAIRKKVLGPEHHETGQSLNNLGYLHQLMGDYPAARAYFEQGVAVFRKARGNEHPETAVILNNLGFLLLEMGEYLTARAHFDEALAINRKALGPEHFRTAVCLHSLGELLSEMGEFPVARPYYEQALAIRKRTFGPDHPVTANSLHSLAQLLHQTGDFAGARRYFEQALAVKRKAFGPEHPETLTTLESLGLLQQAMGDYAAARTSYEQALAFRQKTLGEEHSFVAFSLNYLGLLSWAQGEYATARPYWERALAIHRKTRGPDHAFTGLGLTNLAAVLAAQGDYRTARQHGEQAMAIFRKSLKPDHPVIAVGANNLGFLAKNAGDPAAAQRHYEQALDLLNKGLGPDHPLTAKALVNLGLLHAANGQKDRAWRFLADGAATYNRVAAHVLAGSAETQHAAMLGEWRGNFEGLLSLARETPEQAPALLAAVLDWKAASAQALIARQEALVLGRDPEVQRLHAELKIARHRLSLLLMQEAANHSPRHREILQKFRDRQEELERQLALKVTTYAAWRRARQAGPAEVAQRLPEQAVLVEVVKYRPYDFRAKPGQNPWKSPAYAAVVLARPAEANAPPPVRFLHLGEAKAIDEAIHAWRREASDGAIEPATERAVRELVWEPLARALPAGTRQVILAPDGELALLPFEAIRLADGRYLIEQLQVSYLSNGRDLMPRPGPAAGPGPAVVMADPDYDLRDTPPAPVSADRLAPGQRRSGDAAGLGVRFRSLPGFGREAERAAQAWRAARPREPLQILRGPAADEGGLREIHRPRLLYLVTHGFFLPDLQSLPASSGTRGLEIVPLNTGGPVRPAFREDPRLRSGLALAGANRWKERAEKGQSDGLLTALEVRDLDLWGTELVVLSACDTGLGQVQVGEGVLGLRRAFQQAGAQTVLASLWKVPDAETEKLMGRFFELWLAGKGKAQALRAAQLELVAELRKDPQRRSAPPLLWAGFICHGRPE